MAHEERQQQLDTENENERNGCKNGKISFNSDCTVNEKRLNTSGSIGLPEKYCNVGLRQGNTISFKVGTVFDEFEKLDKAIQEYQRVNHVRLYKRDSRRIETMISRGRAPKKKYSMKLKYGELSYRCRHGGKIYKSLSTGVRPNQSTFKQGCEMHIRFGVSDDGSQLVVKSMSEEHNHEINEESVVKEALHPELCSFVSKLVWNDINIGIDEVKKQLENYVINEMFKDQIPPPRTRRQYFPSKKQIRYFMAKAKSSLNITQEAEMKLEAQAERLKETHSDEKMMFNFRVKHDVNPMDLSVNPEESIQDGDEELLATSAEGRTDSQHTQDNAKVLFCHQTPHQQRLLKRYPSQVFLTQISDIHSKIPFPLFCMYVQTNVDFQLAGEFILQANTAEMISEALQVMKDWNPGWNPKFVIVDYSEEQISAVESVFQGVFLLVSDASREQAWLDWLCSEDNGVVEHKDEVLKYLEAIANSYSEDTLNTSARELEESEVWKMSDKLRNWFQIHWLSQAKRWVAGYRPDDFLLTCHTGRTLEDELKVFRSIKLVNKSSPLQDVIQQLVEHVVPVCKKQYEMLNQESFKLQNELFYTYPDVPNYLSCRPGKLTHHIYERIKIAAELSYVISYLHPGIFTVQGSAPEDDLLHTVSFGDSSSFPSCDCLDWQMFKLPCCHLCAVFTNYPGWSWDMLSVMYKNSPKLCVDWSCTTNEDAKEVPGYRVSAGTQTNGATLLSTTSEFSKISRIGDGRKIAETPQVLASQCRGLLQQLSKLQLAHHSRENLYRLKSELKELISIFSSAPKQKQPPTNPGSPGSFIIQTRGPGRPRKVHLPSSPMNSQQSVFEQYNVKPITPKQVTVAGKLYSTRSSTSSTELVIAKANENTALTQNEDSPTKTIYIVDSGQMLANSGKKVAEDMESAQLMIKANSAANRKRAQADSSVFLRPAEKRSKSEESDDTALDKPDDLQRGVSLEFPEESSGDAVLSVCSTADSTNSISAIIDGQAVNIPLDQVTTALSASLSQSTTQVSVSESLHTPALVTTDSMDEGQFELAGNSDSKVIRESGVK